MTREDIEDNYEFKVVKRILKKEYPFIKNMRLSEDWDKFNSLFFVELEVDIEELYKFMGEEDKISPRIKDWGYYFTKGAPFLSLMIPYEEKDLSQRAGELGTQIWKTARRVQASPSIPPDMKLPRPIDVSSYLKHDNPTITN